jgi:NhaP-type Na+/H+ and K+/H+ antiporter
MLKLLAIRCVLVIDLIQKSPNQQGQLFFRFRFSVIILSVLLQQSKIEFASHTSSHFLIVATTQKVYNYTKTEVKK